MKKQPTTTLWQTEPSFPTLIYRPTLIDPGVYHCKTEDPHPLIANTMLGALQYGLTAVAIGGISYIAYLRFRPLAQAQSSDRELLRKLIDESKVLVLSKSYCPYCSKTKALFADLNAKGVTVIELDLRSDGEGIQSAA